MGTFTVKLLEGASEIASWTPTLTASLTDFDLSLTAGERASVVEWFNLRLSLTADVDRVLVAAATLTTPQVLAVQGVGTPNIASTAQVFTSSSFTVALYDGATLIASREPNLTGTLADYEWTLTPAEFATITSFSDLRLSFTANGYRVLVARAEVGLAPSSGVSTLTLPTIPLSSLTHAPTVVPDGVPVMTVELRQGVTVIATRTVYLGSEFETHVLELTHPEATAITNWGGLSLALIADTDRAMVSWAEFKTTVGDALDVLGIDPGAALYAPTISPGTPGVVVPFLGGGASVYAPSATVGAVLLVLPAIATGETLYAPAGDLVTDTLLLTALAAGSALYAPGVALAAGQTLIVPYAASTLVLYDASVSPGPVTVLVPTLATAASLAAPVVAMATAPTITHEALLWSGERVGLAGFTLNDVALAGFGDSPGTLALAGFTTQELEYAA
jgi:hypothetical protein